MKRYIKDDLIYNAGDILFHDGKQIINPTEEFLLKLGFTPIAESESITLEIAKKNKIKEIENYDVSDNVNQFFINGTPLWIPRETRVSLTNSTNMLKEDGESTTVFWYENMHFELPVDLALNMLKVLERYALKCYNATAIHKCNILEMTSIEDISNYDYTSGYPEKLNFDI